MMTILDHQIEAAQKISGILTLAQIKGQIKRFMGGDVVIDRIHCALCATVMDCERCAYPLFNAAVDFPCLTFARRLLRGGPGVRVTSLTDYFTDDARQLALERYCMAYLIKG